MSGLLRPLKPIPLCTGRVIFQRHPTPCALQRGTSVSSAYRFRPQGHLHLFVRFPGSPTLPRRSARHKRTCHLVEGLVGPKSHFRPPHTQLKLCGSFPRLRGPQGTTPLSDGTLHNLVPASFSIVLPAALPTTSWRAAWRKPEPDWTTAGARLCFSSNRSVGLKPLAIKSCSDAVPHSFGKSRSGMACRH